MKNPLTFGFKEFKKYFDEHYKGREFTQSLFREMFWVVDIFNAVRKDNGKKSTVGLSIREQATVFTVEKSKLKKIKKKHMKKIPKQMKR